MERIETALPAIDRKRDVSYSNGHKEIISDIQMAVQTCSAHMVPQ